MTQGFGLLLGAPGRRAGLAADASLGPPAGRVVSWVGAPEPRTLAGWAGSVQRGSWHLATMSGSPKPGTADQAGSVLVVRAGTAGSLAGVSCALMTGPGEKGGSLAWGISSEHLAMHAETLLWQPDPGGRLVPATVGYLAWRADRTTGIELQWGYAGQMRGALLANRPAVLPGWSGRGYAQRGFAPLSADLRLRVLLHRGQMPDLSGVRGLETKSLVDVQLAKRLSSAVRVGVRYRRTGRQRREWSDRFPWQAARTVLVEDRGVVTGQATWEETGSRVRIMVRTYAREAATGTGRRSLAAFSGRKDWNGNWTFRGSWATAWGDPVDLVSAVSPLKGMVLPRHWGRWRSETVLGLGWSHRGILVQAAVSRRVPAADEPSGPLVTAWSQAGCVW
mgnify:CR=1 FL=1